MDRKITVDVAVVQSGVVFDRLKHHIFTSVSEESAPE